jgi:hypothetical protein
MGFAIDSEYITVVRRSRVYVCAYGKCVTSSYATFNRDNAVLLRPAVIMQIPSVNYHVRAS